MRSARKLTWALISYHSKMLKNALSGPTATHPREAPSRRAEGSWGGGERRCADKTAATPREAAVRAAPSLAKALRPEPPGGATLPRELSNPQKRTRLGETARTPARPRAAAPQALESVASCASNPPPGRLRPIGAAGRGSQRARHVGPGSPHAEKAGPHGSATTRVGILPARLRIRCANWPRLRALHESKWLEK